ASTILWDAPTPRRPSRPVRFLHEPIPPFRPWFAPLGRGRPTGGLGVVGSGLPSGFTMETSGSLRFLGNPGGHCPCSSTPGLTHHNSETGSYGKVHILSKPRLLPFSF